MFAARFVLALLIGGLTVGSVDNGGDGGFTRTDRLSVSPASPWNDGAAGSSPRKSADGASRPPNLVFIAIDDLRPELGCYGVDYVETPNLDALAASGVTFRNHFCAVPTCGASRFALLTGRSPVRSGVRMGNDVLYRGPSQLDRVDVSLPPQTFPEHLRTRGYHTTLIGKLSHTPDGRVYEYNGKGSGRPELPHAWDELSTPFGPWKRGWGAFFAYANGEHREQKDGPRYLFQFEVEDDDDLPDGLMTTHAIEKLREYQSRSDPFFLALGLYKPHLPFVAPRRDREAVEGWKVPGPVYPDGFETRYGTKGGEFFRYHAPWDRARPLIPEAQLKARRAYLACVRYIDRQVGRVLDALEETGLADSTIVVVWSDHGWFLGEGALWGKHTPLERALRSPLIIRTPKPVQPGRMVDAVVSTVDLYPTLLDLCGVEDRKTRFPLDGVSLLPILEGGAARVRSVARSYWQREVTVRSEEFRLIARAESDPRGMELYDLRGGDRDPDRNVVERYPDVAKALLDATPWSPPQALPGRTPKKD